MALIPFNNLQEADQSYSYGKEEKGNEIFHKFVFNYKNKPEPTSILIVHSNHPSVNTGYVYISGKRNHKNLVGPAEIRKSIQSVKQHLPSNIKYLSGVRNTGARGKDKGIQYLPLKESNDDIYHTQDLEEFSDHLKEKHGIHVDLYRTREGHVNLQTLVVPKHLRNQGLASSAIKDIKKYADINKVKIILNVEPLDDSTKEKRLIKFYKGHGFIENKGRNKDYSLGGLFGRNSMYSR